MSSDIQMTGLMFYVTRSNTGELLHAGLWWHFSVVFCQTVMYNDLWEQRINAEVFTEIGEKGY